MLSTRLEELHGEELILKHFSEQSRPSFVYELSAQAVKPIGRMTSEIATLVT
jgi:DNA-binding HxlR family transcriptional regulator